MPALRGMQVDLPGDTPGALDPVTAMEFLNKKDGYEVTEADQQMVATGLGQLIGQFLLDREGVVRWSFSEVPEGGRLMFSRSDPQELMSAVSQVAQ